MGRVRGQPEKEQEGWAAVPSTATRHDEAGPLAELQAQAGNEVVNRLVDANSRTKREAPPAAAGSGSEGDTEAEVGAAGGEVPAAEAAISASAASGSPLPSGVRRAMEGAFGADFGAIRIHAGADATKLNKRLQSQAFTVGPDIFFRGGEPGMTSSSGQELLAHELTHTIQQGAAGAASSGQPAIRRRHSVADLLSGARPKLAVGAASDSAEQEADEVARQVVQALRSPLPAPTAVTEPDGEPRAAKPPRGVIRRSRGADPLAAELQRSTPTSAPPPMGLRSLIQRNGTPLAVGLPEDKKAPTFTAVTREGGEVLDQKKLATLADVIRLARAAVPKARAAAKAVSPGKRADVVPLVAYFNFKNDEEIKARSKKFGDASQEVTVRRNELVDLAKKELDGVLGKVEAGFANDQAIKDVNPKKSGEERGYVNMGTRGFWGSPGDIHLRFSLLDTDPPEDLARTLVHEATHKYAGTSDNNGAYWGKSRFEQLTPKESFKNADSYAWYVHEKGK